MAYLRFALSLAVVSTMVSAIPTGLAAEPDNGLLWDPFLDASVNVVTDASAASISSLVPISSIDVEQELKLPYVPLPHGWNETLLDSSEFTSTVIAAEVSIEGADVSTPAGTRRFDTPVPAFLIDDGRM